MRRVDPGRRDPGVTFTPQQTANMQVMVAHMNEQYTEALNTNNYLYNTYCSSLSLMSRPKCMYNREMGFKKMFNKLGELRLFFNKESDYNKLIIVYQQYLKAYKDLTMYVSSTFGGYKMKEYNY